MKAPIADRIEFTDWKTLSTWLEHEYSMLQPSFNQLYKIGQHRYPASAFSLGQLASKAWLSRAVHNNCSNIYYKKNIAYLGCWIGTLAPWLNKMYNTSRIYGFDIDPEVIAMADDYNAELVESNWQFKGVVEDVTILNWSYPEFVVDGELISDFVPDIIVNTSSEHMSDDWFMSTSKDSLIIMQTNNYFTYTQEHINCVDSIESMQSQYPMRDTLYVGEMITPAYTRYMQIGYPA